MATAPQSVTLAYSQIKAQIATLTLDASIEETHHTEVDSTDSPVEQGVDVTDHLRKKPDRVTIKGMVTNYPLGTVAPQNTNVSTPSGSSFAYMSASQWVPGTAENAYYTLLDLAGSATLITITTALRTYQNMALVSLDVPRTAAIGASLQFTAVFKEIQIVQNQTVQVARAPKQQPNQNTNKQVAQPKNQSIAASGADVAAQSKNGLLQSAGRFVGGLP
jgi:hypothetical protein